MFCLVVSEFLCTEKVLAILNIINYRILAIKELYRYCLNCTGIGFTMRWNTTGFWFRIYICLFSFWGIRGCCSLNDEGLALLELRARITSDPYDALENWNPNDCDPCKWMGVHCVDGKVQMLNLSGLSLKGTLAPELGKLSHLESLILCKNSFHGVIPKELGDLTKLELLDLSENDFSGSIPAEIGRMLLLKHLLVCGNKIEGGEFQDQGKFRFPSKSLIVDSCSSPQTTSFACVNRKFGDCVWQSNINQWNRTDLLIITAKVALKKCFNAFALPLFKLGKSSLHDHEEEHCRDFLPSSDESEIANNIPNLVDSARRKLAEQQQSSNLAAEPFSGGQTKEFSNVPTTLNSGSFPAVPDANKKQTQSPAPHPPPSRPESSHDSSNGKQTNQYHLDNSHSGKENWWKYVIIVVIVVVLVIVIIILFCIGQKPAAKVITPWKTGISGQLQKAFITGVPKLNRSELETACEDFSNIIVSYEACTLYKGTLSSGVEIAVVSTLITTSQDWSKSMEMNYRKKIDTLSRINHKNFINLIGFCEEEEPFTRMLVFEYAPNGNLFEHLHVKEIERLNWSERVRAIMGVAYCLQYIHHDLDPPIALSSINSNMIFMTDDFAAKVAEVTFRNIASAKATGGDSKKLGPALQAAIEANIYEFGMLMLEIVSGKLPCIEEQDNLVNLVSEYLNDKGNISNMIDPNLQSFKDNELDVICEVIHECIQPDKLLRPTMREATSKLREVLGVSPEQAVPRLSPLWWAELEILSVETS